MTLGASQWSKTKSVCKPREWRVEEARRSLCSTAYGQKRGRDATPDSRERARRGTGSMQCCRAKGPGPDSCCHELGACMREAHSLVSPPARWRIWGGAGRLEVGVCSACCSLAVALVGASPTPDAANWATRCHCAARTPVQADHLIDVL